MSRGAMLWIAVGALGLLLMVTALAISPFVCARPDVPCPSPTWAELVFYVGGGVLAAAIVIPVLLAIRSVRLAQKTDRPTSDIRRR